MIETPRRVITSMGWCSRCRKNQPITGPIRVSSAGVRRVQGKCGGCGKRGQNGLLDLAPAGAVAA